MKNAYNYLGRRNTDEDDKSSEEGKFCYYVALRDYTYYLRKFLKLLTDEKKTIIFFTKQQETLVHLYQLFLWSATFFPTHKKRT